MAGRAEHRRVRASGGGTHDCRGLQRRGMPRPRRCAPPAAGPSPVRTSSLLSRSARARARLGHRRFAVAFGRAGTAAVLRELLRCSCNVAASSWRATGHRTGSPGVVRRRTALPAGGAQAIGTEAGRSTRARRAGRRSTACRTRPPTTVCASRNGVPLSDQMLGEVGGQLIGSSAAAIMRVDELRGDQPAEGQRRAQHASSASNSGSLSSCRSRLCASGRPLSVARKPAR